MFSLILASEFSLAPIWNSSLYGGSLFRECPVLPYFRSSQKYNSISDNIKHNSEKIDRNLITINKTIEGQSLYLL